MSMIDEQLIRQIQEWDISDNTSKLGFICSNEELIEMQEFFSTLYEVEHKWFEPTGELIEITLSKWRAVASNLFITRKPKH